ncbi:hypothetical protein AtDm6_1409 [Acetobacter tropicalis]|uniref:Uncharacterized protein n=1 Tax=Acetobacter tropicalis TaxID=104102 RepID=A0A095B4W1_9PROT|nr:hypothetical protein AtDm6_1409 [Acetobacter tropicalis]
MEKDAEKDSARRGDTQRGKIVAHKKRWPRKGTSVFQANGCCFYSPLNNDVER